MTQRITSVSGETLIAWGFKPGKWFKDAINAADKLASENHFRNATVHDEAAMIGLVRSFEPLPIETVSLQDPSNVPIHYNIDADTSFEKDNLSKVSSRVSEIARVPGVREISVMPDACPTGPNDVPVGSVVVTEGTIHPGWHSADICCSVAISVFPSETDPHALLDAGIAISHFGKGGRPYSVDMQVSTDLLDDFERNPYLRTIGGMAQKQFGTQGDGNHFYYVGRLASTGQIALVTHHGSRGPGASLYNAGVDAAARYTGQVCPAVHKNSAWLKYDTEEGQAYWEALQLIRRWTKGNHFAIHDAVAKAVNAKVKDRFWNEHNFIFKREYNGRTFFAHAKGATPGYAYFGPDTFGKTLIPLNMSQPILITQVNNNPDHGMGANHNSLGFCPHGAGRNYSRTEFGKLIAGRAKEMIADVTSKYDVRAYSGKHDISEFPEAYKDANTIISQINKYDLTKVVDLVQPIGCIMAGHDGTDWKAIRKAKKEKALGQANETSGNTSAG
jgi:tRNA-splicing ligase RtcB